METPVTQRWPPGVEHRQDRRRMALVAISLLSTLQGIDQALHTLALPHVVPGLRMSPLIGSLAASLSTLLLAAALLGAGVLGDLAGRRRVLLCGALTMAAGELLCAFAPGPAVFLLGRVVVGLGTAACFGMSLAMLSTIFYDHELPRVFGLWFAIQSVTILTAQFLGAGLISMISWRGAYLVVPVVALVYAYLGRRNVPESKAEHPRHFDYVGVALAAGALVALQLGLGQAGRSGWLSLPVLAGVCVAALIGTAFAWWESRVAEPGFPMALLKVRAFVASCVVGIAFNFANAMVSYGISDLLQTQAGYGPFVVSVVLAPMLLGMAWGAHAGGQAQRRSVGARHLYTSGLLMISVGATTLAVVAQPEHGLWPYAASAALVGFGVMWAQNPQSSLMMASAPKAMVGSVGAFKQAVGQLGYGIGLGTLGPAVHAIRNASQDRLGPKAAYFYGFDLTMLGVVVFTLACLAVVWHLLPAGQLAVAHSEGG